MQTINLKTQGKFYIERCEQCMGLFFDIGELEALLEQSVSNVFHIDTNRIDSINRDLFQHNGTRATYYIKCPVCRIMMNRKNFNTRSGVITDICAEHGVWLEGGELKRLMEWKKAGGQLLHDKFGKDYSLTAVERKKNARKSDDIFSEMMRRESYTKKYLNEDLISSVFNLIGKLF